MSFPLVGIYQFPFGISNFGSQTAVATQQEELNYNWTQKQRTPEGDYLKQLKWSNHWGEKLNKGWTLNMMRGVVWTCLIGKRVFVCSPGSQTRGRAKNSHRITNVQYANYEPIIQKISWSPPPLFFLTRMVFAPLPQPRHNVWQCNKDAREATTWQRCTMAAMVTMVIWKNEPQRAHK